MESKIFQRSQACPWCLTWKYNFASWLPLLFKKEGKKGLSNLIQASTVDPLG